MSSLEELSKKVKKTMKRKPTQQEMIVRQSSMRSAVEHFKHQDLGKVDIVFDLAAEIEYWVHREVEGK